MKILAVGDFHGKVPRFLTKVVKKEKPDIIVSQGDFTYFSLKRVHFDKVYGKDTTLEKVLGKRKVRAANIKDTKAAKKVLKFLDKLGLPLFYVTGNNDYTKWKDVGQIEKVEDMFTPLTKGLKNLKLLDFKTKKYSGFNFIGYPRSSYPGWSKSRKSVYLKKGKIYEYERRKKAHMRYKKKLYNLFKGVKDVIFVSHNVPYGFTKLDVIRSKKADKRAGGHHYGSTLTTEIIKRFKPRLVICGHMHENQGVTRVGKTKVVNCGFGAEGEYAIIELKNKQIKIELRKAKAF